MSEQLSRVAQKDRAAEWSARLEVRVLSRQRQDEIHNSQLLRIA